MLPLLVGTRFQVLFHSPHRSSFHLSLTVLCAIGHRVVFSLGRWSSQIPTKFLVFRGTQGHPRVVQNFTYGAITHYGGTFQSLLLFFTNPMLGPYNPGSTVVVPVWADPRSLAATYGISIDFYSYRYLDVSVPCVRLFNLCIELKIPNKLGGFPHSEILGSKLVYKLPEAYRMLQRPSSPLTAKASTVCT